MKTTDSIKPDAPIYAASNRLTSDAPLGWLKKGWQDFRRAPWHSLSYGVIFAAIGWLLVYLSSVSEIYVVTGLFISLLIVGPALAFGLYDISQQLEKNQAPSFRRERSKALHEMGHELMLALLLSLVFMFLLILTSIVMNIVTISGQAAASAAVPLSNTAFLVVAVIFGGLLFCASSFALPMILDRDADAMTAITTSFHAVWVNKSALVLWAVLVLALVAVAFVTALIGFVLVAPVLGYATWHGYRETINT